MALVPCGSCRRHVRVSEDACPFCKTVRVGTKAVAVAASVFMLAGCGKSFSPVAKYGGPPRRDTDFTVTSVDASDGTPVPDVPDASPRLAAIDAGTGQLVAPTPMYGLPPNRKPTP